MDEPEDANPEVSNGHIDKPNTIGTCGQPIVDMTEGDLLLSEPNIDLEINSTNLEDVRIIKTTLQMLIRNDQHIQTCSGLIANIPDPPYTHVTCSNSSTQHPDQVFGTTSTEKKLAQGRTFDNREIALPCPREVQVTPSNQGTLTDKQRWLKPLQEGKRDRAQATQHEICNSQYTWKVPSDGTGSLGVEFRPKDANGERHSGGSGNATGGSAIHSHGIEKTKIKANPTKRQQSSREQKRAPCIQYTLATTRITLWMLSPPLGFPLNVANTYSPQGKRVGDRDDEDEAEAMPWEGWGGGESTLLGGQYTSLLL
ncbi:hypothetical protein BKA82DRAFT_4019108 [Pisolithus tinctorius]|nr:hypothetical protein BKA82DRAFT_4019108 [Pisolithus tinctorius]